MKKISNETKYCFADGKYLKCDIAACFGSWLIVFDGKYNWMLFDWSDKRCQACYDRGRMPYNKCGSKTMVEYYSTYDNALNNLAVKIVKIMEKKMKQYRSSEVGGIH